MDKLKLTILFFRESENTIIASCPALDISTCGATFEEARANCAEMLDLFFEEASRMGTLEQILSESGLTKSATRHAPPVFLTAETEEVRVPCSL
ncbi:MAG: type II toxin-antitoxin system HicB family antitoxin [Treponematales bacterium]